MGVESKHSYRFVFLKSDKWQNIRLEALVREQAKCQICGFESISNDAHHIHYPPSVWDTELDDLVVLCRACHQLVHDLESLDLVSTKVEKVKSIARIQRIITFAKKWFGGLGGKFPETSNPKNPTDSIEKEIKFVDGIVNCSVCRTKSTPTSTRQFRFTYMTPKSIKIKFCDRCFDLVNNSIPVPSDLFNKGLTYKSIRLAIEKLTKDGSIMKC